MKTLIMSGAAALAFVAGPVVAQDAVAIADGEDVYVMTDDQTILYDAWPYERRTAYDAWPYNVQEYYWTLEEPQTNAWWMLDDTQRVNLYNMTPAQRTTAWQQINAQMNSMNNASTTGMTARTTAPATMQPRFVRSEVTQTTPAGYKASSQGADLPVCTPRQQDGCINSWEKNKTGNRPLEYWPGRPASEIDEPLPATRPDSDD